MNCMPSHASPIYSALFWKIASVHPTPTPCPAKRCEFLNPQKRAKFARKSWRSDRGREAGCPAPPAQIRTCPLGHPAPASGQTSGSLSSRKRRLACRRAAWITLARRCVRRVLWLVGLPLAPVLPSTNSARAFAPLFAGFISVGSEEAPRRADLRPPHKRPVRFSRRPLSPNRRRNKERGTQSEWSVPPPAGAHATASLLNR